LALSGLRPIVLLPSSMPLLEGLAGLREATLLPWRSSEALSVPLLIVAPCGPGFGLGGDAIEGPEALMARVPGLRVLIAGDALEAGALLHAAAEFWAGEQPTVVFLPRGLLLQEAQFESAPRQLTRPFAAARPVRTGTAATVFTWGNAVASTLVAVARTGLDVGVVDVECLAPLDRGTLVEQARRTGKLVIVHEGPRAHGLGAELAALFADEAILHLDAPIVRVTGDEPPFRAEHEGRAAPTIESIAEAITHVATY
jgi:pyruvate/2-oxoglutarate/acetoin dehydrogenase E1 component